MPNLSLLHEIFEISSLDALHDEAKNNGFVRAKGGVKKIPSRLLVDLPRLSVFFGSHSLKYPDVEIIKNEVATSPATATGGLVDKSVFLNDLKAGASFRVRGAQNRFAGLQEFCAKLTRDVGASTWANIYVSGGEAKSFAPHYDDHDVIITQTHGCKNWYIYQDFSNQISYPRENHRQRDKKYEPIGEPIEIVLSEGDALFIPRGVMHKAETDGTSSIHVTFGVTPVTARELLLSVFTVAENEYEDLRRPIAGRILRSDFDGSKLQEFLSQVIPKIFSGQNISKGVDLLKEDQIRRAPPTNTAGLHFLYCDSSKASETKLKLSDSYFRILDPDAEKLQLETKEQITELNEAESQAFRFVNNQDSWSIDKLNRFTENGLNPQKFVEELCELGLVDLWIE